MFKLKELVKVKDKSEIWSEDIKSIRWNGFLRALIEIVVLLGSFYIAEWIMPYTVLAGLFGRKFAPFLVPVMERFRLRNETGDSAMIK